MTWKDDEPKNGHTPHPDVMSRVFEVKHPMQGERIVERCDLNGQSFSWLRVSWEVVRAGDIVRFREPHTNRLINAGGSKYHEVRSWRVERVVDGGLDCEPHDYDLA